MRRVNCFATQLRLVGPHAPLTSRMQSTSAALIAAATQPTDDALRQILRRYQHIAVVGISSDESKPSHHVAAMMQLHGQYHIIPVRPGTGIILGEQIVPRLSDIPQALAPNVLVNVFRKPEDVEPIVDEAIAMGATAVWFQLGVVNEKAIAKATSAGLTVVADRCLWIEFERLGNR